VQRQCSAPRFHQVCWEIRPLFVEKETAQFFGLVSQGFENVALKSRPILDFLSLFGFFLLIMITLEAKND